MLDSIESLVDKALQFDKFAIGKLISVFENTLPTSASKRKQILDLLASRSAPKAFFVGFTGSPGAGKSSLIGVIGLRLLHDSHLSCAVLAIDPSSEKSGGSILGDRTRVRFPLDEKRLFFRSQAADKELGGVSRASFSVCRLLQYIFDLVIIETVGIGQNELEIQHLADRIYLVLQPLGGDQIQFMKAGIMEMPDVFLINKSDEVEAARKSYHSLKASIDFTRPGEEQCQIIQTSTVSGLGLEEVCQDLLLHRQNSSAISGRKSMRERELIHFSKWVKDEFGRRGLHVLRDQGGPEQFVKDGFEEGQKVFAEDYSHSRS